MKKIMALAITTIMVSSVPMTAMAAECNIKDKLSSLTKTNSTYSLKDLCTSNGTNNLCDKLNFCVDSGKCDNESFKNGKFDVITGNNGVIIVGGINCDTSNKPSTPTVPSIPSLPEKPETDKPSIPNIPEKPSTPETDKPETEKPGDSNKPGDTEKPEEDNSTSNTNQTAQEKKLASQVIDMVNEERAKQGLKPLKMNVNVQKAAQTRSEEITKSFSHTRPNGSSFSTALKENSVSYRSAGENIAYGQKTAEAVMNGWMNSSGHRANILNNNFEEIGVGVHIADNGTIYWTQLFIK